MINSFGKYMNNIYYYLTLLCNQRILYLVISFAKPMKISILLFGLLLVSTFAYLNPIQGFRDSPDPGVVYDGQNYYAVTT
jgi:hypothetical protein